MLFSLRKYKYNNGFCKKKPRKNDKSYPKKAFFWFFRPKKVVNRDFLPNFVR